MITVTTDTTGRFVVTDSGRQIVAHTSDRGLAFGVAKRLALKNGISRLTWLGKPITF